METSDPSDDLVRVRAFALWEKAGCPTDAAEAFWYRARAELAKESASYDTTVEDSFPASDPPSQSGVTGPKSAV